MLTKLLDNLNYNIFYIILLIYILILFFSRNKEKLTDENINIISNLINFDVMAVKNLSYLIENMVTETEIFLPFKLKINKTLQVNDFLEMNSDQDNILKISTDKGELEYKSNGYFGSNNSNFTSELLPSGSIIAFSGEEKDVPVGWVICDGRKINENSNELTPNLKDRFIYGGTNINSKGGSETVTLTENEMPSHNHSVTINQAGAHTHTYDGIDGRGSGWAGGRYGTRDGNTTGMFGGNHTHGNARMNSTGGGQPHDNMPPYYVVMFIMKR